jgi:hypothetical protein
LGVLGLRAVAFLTAGVLATFLTAGVASATGAGVSTLYGAGLTSIDFGPKIFFKNDSIITLLVKYLVFK